MPSEPSDVTGPAVVTAGIVIIGNEVLSGRTQDANLNYLAGRLTELGVRVMEARVVRDEEAAIVEAVNHVRTAYDYVFTTGGIGPTHDDITARCIARAFGLPFGRNAEAQAILHDYYKGEVTEARLRMAEMPEGAALIENPVSGAPGFQIDNVFVLAGVPRIMQAMFEGMTHRITGGAPVLSRSVAANLAEGTLAGPLNDVQARFPNTEIGSYPYFRGGKLGSSLVVRTTDAEALDQALAAIRAMIRELGGEPIDEDDAPAMNAPRG